MYKNYIFDLYGTLVDLHTNEDKPYLWKKMATLYSSYGASYTSTEYRQAYKRICEQKKLRLLNGVSQYTNKPIIKGEIELLKVFDQLFVDKGVTPKPEETSMAAQTFRILSTSYIRLYDQVIAILEGLRSKGKKIYLLSNAQSCFTRRELVMLGIEQYFDDIFISSDWEHQKPDPAFFEQLLLQNGLDKKETIMIGNDPVSDIEGANAVGLDSLFINSGLPAQKDQVVNSTYCISDGNMEQMKKILLGSKTEGNV